MMGTRSRAACKARGARRACFDQRLAASADFSVDVLRECGRLAASVISVDGSRCIAVTSGVLKIIN